VSAYGVVYPELDLAMSRVWPASTVRAIGPWLARFNGGVTRRANSVLCLGTPDDIVGACAAGERFFDERGARPRFMVSDASTPDPVVRHLVEAGYQPDADSWILTASVDRLRQAASGWSDERWATESSPGIGDEWFETYWSVEGGRHSDRARRIIRTELLRPATPAAFIAARDLDGTVQATAELVADGEWGCGQCLVTLPSARRSGAARAALGAMVAVAGELGVRGVFVAVMADNSASLGLCESVGFEKSHRYRYYEPLARTPAT